MLRLSRSQPTLDQPGAVPVVQHNRDTRPRMSSIHGLLNPVPETVENGYGPPVRPHGTPGSSASCSPDEKTESVPSSGSSELRKSSSTEDTHAASVPSTSTESVPSTSTTDSSAGQTGPGGPSAKPPRAPPPQPGRLSSQSTSTPSSRTRRGSDRPCKTTENERRLAAHVRQNGIENPNGKCSPCRQAENEEKCMVLVDNGGKTTNRCQRCIEYKASVLTCNVATPRRRAMAERRRQKNLGSS